jgi:hypothetical protein
VPGSFLLSLETAEVSWLPTVWCLSYKDNFFLFSLLHFFRVSELLAPILRPPYPWALCVEIQPTARRFNQLLLENIEKK